MTAAPAPVTDQAPATERGVLLDAKNVTMQFGGLRAVGDVSMQVHSGEIVGLIGPNGAGKTTFFNCLTGLYKPTAGSVTFAGEPFRRSRARSCTPGWRAPSRTSGSSTT